MLRLQGNAGRKAQTRHGINAQAWQWRTVLKGKWAHHAHINVLELKALLASLRWRLRQPVRHGCRCFHLVDSLVTMAAATKGRSSSRRLQPNLKKLAALLAAGRCRITLGYVKTHRNPADRPSRESGKKTSLPQEEGGASCLRKARRMQ